MVTFIGGYALFYALFVHSPIPGRKAAGLPVHRGPQAKGRVIPVLTDHLDALRFGLPRRPEAAHRLDKDTSGCLVLGRHPRATGQPAADTVADRADRDRARLGQ